MLDPRWPDLSIYDQPFIHAAYRNSKIDNVITDADIHDLPAYAFGSELARDWCFYYQKADLARQQGHWDEIARLGMEVQQLELHPNDQIEWMPFLHAYLLLGDVKQVKGISSRMNTEPFYRYQACIKLNAIENTLSAEMQNEAYGLFCN